MKKALNFDYVIDFDNMESFTENPSNGEMILYEAEFFTSKGEETKKMVLKNDKEVGSVGCKQIFKMKDGKHILEIEDENGVDYFYSNKIEDLL